MTQDRTLTPHEAGTAAAVQQAIDAVAAVGGGCLRLPAMELTLDRGLILRDGVELVGQGPETVLRKGPGRIYPLSGYHNYGMCDVPLVSAAGLAPGMTVSIHDDRTHGGFYETFAVITWVDGDWVGLDHGIEADYRADQAPCLTTVYPLVCGHRIRGAAVRDLTLEANRQGDPKAMGGCRGGAVYFYQSRDLEITGIAERDYFGEGLSFQMCRDVVVRDCRFDGNAGNGMHPGAGSTNALFENCQGAHNGRSGFFFCVRANHITVRDCRFTGNRIGISIGTRDCHNVIEDCVVTDNAGAGLLTRPSPAPVEVHSCLVRRCHIVGNAGAEGRAQVEIAAAAHDLIFADNEMAGGAGADKPAFHVDAAARRIHLRGNRVRGGATEVAAAASSLIDTAPVFDAGYGSLPETAWRHLPA